MIFGPLGSLPLGGFKQGVVVYVTPPASFFRKRGRKWEPDEPMIVPDWEINLQKAREALWEKRYEKAILEVERDENLQKAWVALFKKFADEEKNKPREEIRRTYYENIPENILQRMQLVEARVGAWKFAKDEEARLKRVRVVEENRLLALDMAREATEAKKQRQEEIYQQRVKSLKKARRVKAKRIKNAGN
jgi:hypothetical protein